MQPQKAKNEKNTNRIHLSPLTINRCFTNVTLRSNSSTKKNSRHRKSLSLTNFNESENLAPKNDKLSNNRISYDDRYIPNQIKDINNARAMIDGQYETANAILDSQISNMRVNAAENFNLLRSAVSDNDFENCRILAFGDAAPKSSEAAAGQTVNFVRVTSSKPKWRLKRFVPTMPERVLDAPDLVNDYYLNILHWGSLSGLAIGLGSVAYVLDTNNGKINKICATKNGGNFEENEYVSGVRWAGSSAGACLGVGYSSGHVRLFDVATGKLLRTLLDANDRIPSLSWNGNILSCGTKRGVVINYDVRVEKARISVLNSHVQEICGLAWSANGSYLASGGNDNDICVWDKIGAVSDGPILHRFVGHRAAVKAVAWHPRQTNILVTGGGLADHSLNFWNVSNGFHLSSHPTNSQISGIVWNPRSDEMVTSHGFPQNQLTLWSYPSMEIAANLISHTDRVLALTLSPDGNNVASIGADETVRIWKCFDNQQKSSNYEESNLKAHSIFN